MRVLFRLLFLSFALPTICFGQKTFTAHVYETKTRIALTGIMVDNVNNQQIAMSDDHGKFFIKAKIGDLLILKGFAYKTDTLLITDIHEQEIFLQPKQNILKEVTVNTTETNNGAGFKDPEFKGQSVIYQRDVAGYYKGGIIIRLWYWKKQDKLAKDAGTIKDVETREDILKTFSPENLMQYLPLQGQELDAFTIRYIPDVKTYKSRQFNLLIYLNTCYKEFMMLTPQKRIPQKLE